MVERLIVLFYGVLNSMNKLEIISRTELQDIDCNYSWLEKFRKWRE
jgi:hypothetical protein